MNTVHEQAATVADKMTFAGSAGTLLGWATSSVFGMWVGILIGIGGLAINLYFKIRSDKRAQVAHEAHMAKLRHPTAAVHEPQEADE